jgi:hypothetical protein
VRVDPHDADVRVTESRQRRRSDVAGTGQHEWQRPL